MGKGCMEHLFILKEMRCEALEENKPLYMGFLDIKKAYDTVFREGLMVILWKNKLIRYWLVLPLLRGLWGRSPPSFRGGCWVKDSSVVPSRYSILFFPSKLSRIWRDEIPSRVEYTREIHKYMLLYGMMCNVTHDAL